jgi:hypothetical protein
MFVLNYDVLRRIAELLSLEDLLNFRAVNKENYAVVNDIFQDDRKLIKIRKAVSMYAFVKSRHFEFRGMRHGTSSGIVKIVADEGDLRQYEHDDILDAGVEFGKDEYEVDLNNTIVYRFGELVSSQGSLYIKSLYVLFYDRPIRAIRLLKPLSEILYRSDYVLKCDGDHMVLTLNVMIRTGLTLVWRYPKCNADITQLRVLRMPPFVDTGYAPEITMSTCSLDIYEQNRLVFKYRCSDDSIATEHHYRDEHPIGMVSYAVLNGEACL